MGCRYAGIDWATEKHDVRVADETGEKLLAATFAHDEAGLLALCRTLVKMEVGLVAIERPDGVLVERLLDAGLKVLALHPNKVAAARDRFRVSGGKSDRFDAFVLCELARTDNHRFRVLEPDSDQTRALRALTRAREDLVHTRTAVVNQLRAELDRCWPGPVRLFSHLDSEILLACWAPLSFSTGMPFIVGIVVANERTKKEARPATTERSNVQSPTSRASARPGGEVAAPAAGVKRRSTAPASTGRSRRRLTRSHRAQLDGNEVVLAHDRSDRLPGRGRHPGQQTAGQPDRALPPAGVLAAEAQLPRAHRDRQRLDGVAQRRAGRLHAPELRIQCVGPARGAAAQQL